MSEHFGESQAECLRFQKWNSTKGMFGEALPMGEALAAARRALSSLSLDMPVPPDRGLHSFPLQLKLSSSVHRNNPT